MQSPHSSSVAATTDMNASMKLTFTTWHHWAKDDALLESGLLGPVMLQTCETILIN
jgi:hypothetical protein